MCSLNGGVDVCVSSIGLWLQYISMSVGLPETLKRDRQECKCSNEHVLSIIFPKLACWTCLKMATQSMYPPVNVYSLLLKNAIEIVDFPIKNGDCPIKNGGSFFPYSYVKKIPNRWPWDPSVIYSDIFPGFPASIPIRNIYNISHLRTQDD